MSRLHVSSGGGDHAVCACTERLRLSVLHLAINCFQEHAKSGVGKGPRLFRHWAVPYMERDVREVLGQTGFTLAPGEIVGWECQNPQPKCRASYGC